MSGQRLPGLERLFAIDLEVLQVEGEGVHRGGIDLARVEAVHDSVAQEDLLLVGRAQGPTHRPLWEAACADLAPSHQRHLAVTRVLLDTIEGGHDAVRLTLQNLEEMHSVE